jgi:flagellar motor switch protein FliN
MGLVLPVDEDEGIENMGDNINLWDSIEVEINAQFESVKITLGELKAIEAGTVIDLTSIYNNKVTLSVENKPIAKGELVIINDRYGVKITDVADTNEPTQSEEILQELAPSEVEQSAEPGAEDEFISEEGDAFEHPVSDIPGADNSDEDFDYSDFELEDEDI